MTNDSGKAVRSDEFTVNVDAVTKITIDKTDTYMNVGMTGTLTTAFKTIGNPTDSEKSVKWNSSAPKTVSVKDGVITALKAGTRDNNSKRIGQHFRQYRNNGHGFTQSAEDYCNKAASSARSIQ
ncbi:MAG: Ig-like domain-containing protein [[Eubacterium] siraeum]